MLWLLFEKVSILLFFFSGSMRGQGGGVCFPPCLRFSLHSPPTHGRICFRPRGSCLATSPHPSKSRRSGPGTEAGKTPSVTYRTAARDTDLFAGSTHSLIGAKASGAHHPMLWWRFVSSDDDVMASVMMVMMMGARVVVSSCRVVSS